ncbi:MAG: thermonuclease family protein, partial [Cellvibrio sp.]
MSLVNIPGLKIKTPSVQTLGVLVFGRLSSCFCVVSTADCLPDGQGEIAVVDRIQDGDTVKLKDGRHVRVLGINTPEVTHGDKPGQALGQESRQEAEGFFRADKQIRIFYDIQRFDRYGRTLAHVYDAKGNSLAAHLLRKGLGFHVAIPPNVSLNQCLHKQETIARDKSLGVWSNRDWRPITASKLKLNE